MHVLKPGSSSKVQIHGHVTRAVVQEPFLKSLMFWNHHLKIHNTLAFVFYYFYKWFMVEVQRGDGTCTWSLEPQLMRSMPPTTFYSPGEFFCVCSFSYSLSHSLPSLSSTRLSACALFSTSDSGRPSWGRVSVWCVYPETSHGRTSIGHLCLGKAVAWCVPWVG